MARAASISALLRASLFVLALLVADTIGTSRGDDGFVPVSALLRSSEESGRSRDEAPPVQADLTNVLTRERSKSAKAEKPSSGAPSKLAVEDVLMADPASFFQMLILVDYSKELDRAHNEINSIVKAKYVKTRKMVARNGRKKVNQRFFGAILSGLKALVNPLITGVMDIFKDKGSAPEPKPTLSPPVSTPPGAVQFLGEFGHCEKVMICRQPPSTAELVVTESRKPVKTRGSLKYMEPQDEATSGAHETWSYQRELPEPKYMRDITNVLTGDERAARIGDERLAFSRPDTLDRVLWPAGSWARSNDAYNMGPRAELLDEEGSGRFSLVDFLSPPELTLALEQRGHSEF